VVFAKLTSRISNSNQGSFFKPNYPGNIEVLLQGLIESLFSDLNDLFFFLVHFYHLSHISHLFHLLQMEDEGNHGNDETRCFILSTLAAHNSPKVVCLLCQSTLPVYDRYPLVDGTFFLSPRQHSKHCFEVSPFARIILIYLFFKFIYAWKTVF
jgi:hypothetical protein